MNRAALALCFAILTAIAPLGAAGAHELAKDGRISAFLHIAPDDVPRPGKFNTLHFYINDQDLRFSMEGCFCSAVVKEDKNVLFKGDLAAEDIRVGKLNVLLPDNDKDYEVAVSGTPKTAGFFQPFKLKFDIDVGNPPPRPAGQNRSWILFVLGIIIIGTGSVIIYISLKRRKKKSSS